MKKEMIKMSMLLAVVLCLFSCKEEEKKAIDTFTVSGTVKGLDTKYMEIDYYDETGQRLSDSVLVKDNSFSYTSKITKPTYIRIWPNVERTVKGDEEGYIPVPSSEFLFLASPGDQIKFEGEITDFVNAYPSGTKTNDDLAKINRSIFPLMNKAVNIELKMYELSEDDSTNMKKMDDAITTLEDEIITLKKEFVTSNLSSKAAVWNLLDMMEGMEISDEEAIQIFKSIDPSLKQYLFYQEIEMRIKGIESTSIGKTVPDFMTTNTMDGTAFQLSSLKGKYLLIDFWGTWCGPCIDEMPKVKEYKEKYKDELVVLGINYGDTKERIEKFITPKDYRWKQLLSGRGAEGLMVKFNVTAFPTKFIIDPNGKIIHRFEGGGEECFVALDEILSK